jgi:hypothetical protein
VSAGRLTKDHLVVVRNRHDSGGFHLEATSLDPDSPASETEVFTATGGGPNSTSLVIDRTSGDLYLLDQTGGVGSPPDWGPVRRFRWNGSNYVESAVTTAGKAKWGLEIGPAGELLSFDGSTAVPERILRIDPSGFDSLTHYAALESSTFLDNRFRGWSFDAEGKLWAALADLRSVKGKPAMYSFVSEVPQGGTVRFKDRIAELKAYFFHGITTGPSGKVYVAEQATISGVNTYTLYELAPSEDGGGGGKPPKKPK